LVIPVSLFWHCKEVVFKLSYIFSLLAVCALIPRFVQVMIFFSAHGVPLAYVEEAGDPYKAEMEECVDLIMEELETRKIRNPFTLAYQVNFLFPFFFFFLLLIIVSFSLTFLSLDVIH